MTSPQAASAGSGPTGQGGLASPGAKYEEPIELEALKRENESLRRRIKELEARMRRGSVSASASERPPLVDGTPVKIGEAEAGKNKEPST